MLEISLTEARNNLNTLIEKVEKGALIKLTRYGKPIAVIMSYKDWEIFKPQKKSAD